MTNLLNPYRFSVVGGGGGDAPVVQGFTLTDTSAGAVTSLDATKPTDATIESGDLLMLIAIGERSAGTNLFNPVTGWTQEIEEGTGAADAHLSVYWREADGTEPVTQAVTVTAAGEFWGVYYLHITDADTTSPFDIIGTAKSENQVATATPDGVTTTVDNTLAFVVHSFDGGDGFPFSITAGWDYQEFTTGSTAGARSSGLWATKEMATAGSTGNPIITPNATDGHTSIVFAIAPA